MADIKAKLEALQTLLKQALNPPKTVAMTVEEFVKYSEEQVGKALAEEPEAAKRRLLALNDAFTAGKAAAETKAEKFDVPIFEQPVVPDAPIAAAPITEPAPVVAPVTEPPAAVPPAVPDVTKAAPFVWPSDMSDPKARAELLKTPAK